MRELKFKGIWEDDGSGRRHSVVYGIGGKPHLMGGTWLAYDLQYTESKDKNLNEIYEGDILQVVASPKYSSHNGLRSVIWSGDLQWELAEKKHQYGLPLAWGAWEELEIVGNVIETPEMLNV